MELKNIYLKLDQNKKVVGASFEKTDYCYCPVSKDTKIEEVIDFLDFKNKNLIWDVKKNCLIEQEKPTVTIELLQKEIEKRNEIILETQLAMAELTEMVTQLF